MTANQHLQCLLLLATGALIGVAGCLERKETIRVARDGAVEIEIQYKGDPEDFATGDAMPDQHSGWRVVDEVKTDDEGKQEQTRRGRLRFAAGQPLPDSYASPHDPDYVTALAFPTEVTVERRRDGWYYHFRRVYEGRQYARFAYYRRLVEQDKELQTLMQGDPSELSDEARTQLITRLRKVEALQHAEYLASAAETLAEEWPQHYGLLLRQTLLNNLEQPNIEPILELLDAPQSAERDTAIDDFGRRLVEEARDQLRDTMRELRLPRDQIAAFDAAYDEEQARWAVTEDIGDEAWEIRLKLPGELVASNGERQEDGFVAWCFDGEALRDRNVVLMATSRLARPGIDPDDEH
ncbi:MAG: hypothetical protein KKB50_05015 [Planctomycetes bacterium]|nr:hypothetical protein [Planctomycetota bacterium]